MIVGAPHKIATYGRYERAQTQDELALGTITNIFGRLNISQLLRPFYMRQCHLRIWKGSGELVFDVQSLLGELNIVVSPFLNPTSQQNCAYADGRAVCFGGNFVFETLWDLDGEDITLECELTDSSALTMVGTHCGTDRYFQVAPLNPPKHAYDLFVPLVVKHFGESTLIGMEVHHSKGSFVDRSQGYLTVTEVSKHLRVSGQVIFEKLFISKMVGDEVQVIVYPLNEEPWKSRVRH